VTPQLLSHMAEELQGCQFLLETGATHTLYDQLDAHALDMIVAAEFGAEADWAEVHPIMREGFAVAAPRGMIDTSGDILRQLKKEPLIQYTQRQYMGRLISQHLARQNLTLPYRFELDSYHAILALVGQGAGWTILTPLALMRARRFADQLDVFELPFEPLSRVISLTARKDMFQALPGQVADTLRQIIKRSIVRPAIARHPFLKDLLSVIQ